MQTDVTIFIEESDDPARFRCLLSNLVSVRNDLNELLRSMRKVPGRRIRKDKSACLRGYVVEQDGRSELLINVQRGYHG